MNDVKPKVFTEDDLALMWCRLNSWRHPVSDTLSFPRERIDGAMSLISTLIGYDKCLEVWNLVWIQKRHGH